MAFDTVGLEQLATAELVRRPELVEHSTIEHKQSMGIVERTTIAVGRIAAGHIAARHTIRRIADFKDSRHIAKASAIMVTELSIEPVMVVMPIMDMLAVVVVAVAVVHNTIGTATSNEGIAVDNTATIATCIGPRENCSFVASRMVEVVGKELSFLLFSPLFYLLFCKMVFHLVCKLGDLRLFYLPSFLPSFLLFFLLSSLLFSLPLVDQLVLEDLLA